MPLRRTAGDPPKAPPLPTFAGDRAIARWLLLCCAMVFAMIVIGGITRLTESGLSIAEWRPVSGILPPLDDADWQELFALYRQTPEYLQVNRGMALAEFKAIFWWEYVHRLWGRLIGVAFALPFVWFLLRGRIRRGLLPHLAAILGLGTAQGLLGWYMVRSGLAERADVSQYRLAAHLVLALAIYAYMLWIALGLLRPAETAGQPVAGLRRGLIGIAAIAGLAMLYGALVAGLDGGLIYNSFPLMGGRLVPDDLLEQSPAWRNLFENPATVQFVHRVLAAGLVAATLWLWLAARHRGLPRPAATAINALVCMVLLQAVLGIATLLLVVPVPLAVAHQAGAVLLLSLLVRALHATRGDPVAEVRAGGRIDRPAADFQFYNRRGSR